MGVKNLDKKVRDHVYEVQTIVHSDQTISKAIKVLRQKTLNEKVLYFYVLDSAERLVGIVSARDLLLNPADTHVHEIMDRDVVTLRGNQSLKEAMSILETQHLLALPVVDDGGKFIGVIDVSHYLEESVDIANTKERVQIFQMLGFFLDEGKKTSVWRNYITRMPWLFCNMFGGFICAAISRVFQPVLSSVIILAMFIPLVLSLSEAISMQSMTQSLTFIPNAKFLKAHPLKAAFRQWKLFFMIAFSCAIVVGLISILWGEGLGPPFAIGVSVMVTVLVNAFIGAFVPIFLHMRSLDPKFASGPIVLTTSDVLTTFIYLGVSTWFLL